MFAAFLGQEYNLQSLGQEYNLQSLGQEYNLQSLGKEYNLQSPRVLTIIPHMCFTKLNKMNILPPPMFTKVVKKGGDFPKVAKKGGYAWFGIFIDYLIRDILSTKIVPTEESVQQVFRSTLPMGFLEGSVKAKEVCSEMKYYTNIGLWILTHFTGEEKMEIEPEISFGSITGHPDLIIGDTIYDIKTTGMFGRMRTKTILQLLCYYCIAKKLNKDVKNIGLILPAQQKIEKISIERWKWEPFWDKMIEAVEKKVCRDNDFDPIKILELQMWQPNIGYHIRKVYGTVWKSVDKLSSHFSCQIFLTGNCEGDINVSLTDINKTLDIINKKKLKLFVHTPYIINLCHEEGSPIPPKYKNGKQIEIRFTTYNPQKMLKEQLLYTRKLGGKGAVVHCGKKGQYSITQALCNMYENIVTAATNATKECPLLIETGAGTEILSDVHDLGQFYLDLPEETKTVTAICVDTCHVFAAGYQPMDAVKTLEELNVPIKLFHFNDSKYEFDSKKDGHACPGQGLIPIQQLIDIAVYAVGKNIPMVQE